MGFGKRRHAYLLGFMWGFALWQPSYSFAVSVPFSLPDELEAVGGMGTAQSQSGVAVASDLSAIRINPAMLFRNQTYDVNGSYFWPALGRPFYKAGVIDGVTSRNVAAFEYTGFQDNPSFDPNLAKLDTPVLKRASVAIAIPTDFFSLGLAAHYVEANDYGENQAPKTLKGFTLGVGLIAYVTDEIRVGLSAQNLNNRNVAKISPQVLRAGIAWEEKKGNLIFGLDYRERQRSLGYEWPSDPEFLSLVEPIAKDYDKPERMVLSNIQVRTFDIVKVFASYGKSLDKIERQQAGGGLGLFHKTFSLAYAVNKNLPAKSELQSSLNLSFSTKM